jgi:uncharacterized protein Yka (UPF0111/DUF47 family)
MLDICQNHARQVVEIVRELALLVDSVAEGKSKAAKQHYTGIVKLQEEANKLKGTLLQEVASAGSLLVSREDFLRLIFRMGEMADRGESFAYRLMGVADGRLKVDKKMIMKLSGLMELVLKEVSKVRETLHSLSFDPEKAVDFAKNVEELERKIDTESRNLDLDVLNSRMSPPNLLFVRDLVDRAETMADVGLDVVDLIRLLAVTA